VPARYHYTTLFADFKDLIRHNLARHADYFALDTSRLEAQPRRHLAQATHKKFG